MVRNRQGEHFVNLLINKTDDLICVYEQQTGEIIKAYPDKLPFPWYSSDLEPAMKDKTICFIVTPKQFDEIRTKFPERQVDDIGILMDPTSPGRDNMPIGKIFWAQDPKVEVLFMKSLHDHIH